LTLAGRVGEVEVGEGVVAVTVGVVVGAGRRLVEVGVGRIGGGEQVALVAGLGRVTLWVSSAGWGMSGSMVAAWWVSSSTR
jgi:hypothetical protein